MLLNLSIIAGVSNDQEKFKRNNQHSYKIKNICASRMSYKFVKLFRLADSFGIISQISELQKNI